MWLSFKWRFKALNPGKVFLSLVSRPWLRFLNRPGPVSMVLFLREPASLPHEKLSAVLQQPWCISSVADASESLITLSGDKGLVYVKPHLISILNSNKPYLSLDANQQGKLLLQPRQRDAWIQHRGWISLDYLKGGQDLESEYAILARFAAEILDTNCSGLYIPREGSFIPNDASLRGVLEQIAAKTR